MIYSLRPVSYEIYCIYHIIIVFWSVMLSGPYDSFLVWNAIDISLKGILFILQKCIQFTFYFIEMFYICILLFLYFIYLIYFLGGYLFIYWLVSKWNSVDANCLFVCYRTFFCIFFYYFSFLFILSRWFIYLEMIMRLNVSKWNDVGSNHLLVPDCFLQSCLRCLLMLGTM